MTLAKLSPDDLIPAVEAEITAQHLKPALLFAIVQL